MLCVTFFLSFSSFWSSTLVLFWAVTGFPLAQAQTWTAPCVQIRFEVRSQSISMSRSWKALIALILADLGVLVGLCSALLLLLVTGLALSLAQAETCPNRVQGFVCWIQTPCHWPEEIESASLADIVPLPPASWYYIHPVSADVTGSTVGGL